jgi:hypothetical protein
MTTEMASGNWSMDQPKCLNDCSFMALCFVARDAGVIAGIVLQRGLYLYLPQLGVDVQVGACRNRCGRRQPAHLLSWLSHCTSLVVAGASVVAALPASPTSHSSALVCRYVPSLSVFPFWLASPRSEHYDFVDKILQALDPRRSESIERIQLGLSSFLTLYLSWTHPLNVYDLDCLAFFLRITF